MDGNPKTDTPLAKLRRYGTLSAMIMFIVFWTALITIVGPENLVSMVGVEEVHAVAFFLAVFGALSSLTPVSIYPAIGTFAAGGANPIILGIVAGAGLAIGDSFFFFLGKEVRGAVSGYIRRRLKGFLEWLKEYPWFVPVAVYLYVAFTPFPNNVLTGGLAFTGYRFRRLILPLMLGDLTLAFMVASVAYYGLYVF
ncbi:MAG: hypothetical protein R6U32_01990 [Candidatus Woesearchaeota archaeon]